MTRVPGVLLGACLALPVATGAQGLFKGDEPLEVTLTTSLRLLLRDRDSTKRVLHGAELTYKDSAGAVVRIPVGLRTRGHFRRLERNCDFPPLKLEITKEAARKTVFEGNRTLKVATNCRPGNAEYEQYILKEYAVFRMYQALTPWSYRTRLAHFTYADSAGKAKPVESWGFFVEDDGDLVQRRHVKKFETKGAYFDDLEPTKTGCMSLFAYMIGNTDWSVGALHNVTLLRDSLAVIHPVPFDFDWSGAVDARYAFPDKSLPIRNVKERTWRGDCRNAEAMAPIFQRFLSRRAAMDSVPLGIAAMTPATREKMSRYFAEFWPLLRDPKQAVSIFSRTCKDRN
ncbi:MAG: hypothetical protein ACYC3L_12450 [Gemmatimonadaceae bacterium]